jgi:predicted transcriptional regulator
MGKTTQTTEKTASKQVVLKALAAKPRATAVEIASTTHLGRSTVSKVLARLASVAEVHRTEGGHDGSRRLPDRFALAT